MGYEESQIRYSDGYTVLYAGAIVDTCSSYQSFATDREERLDGYLQEYGSGWLWYEPPLVGPNSKAYAKKGFALTQDLWSMNPDEGLHTNDFGLFPINMRFVVDAKKVHRADVSANVSSSTNAANRDTIYRDFPLRSATMKCLLDCGATFPMLGKSDFKYLGIDDFGTHYAPQTVMAIETASRIEHLPLYELKVEVGVAVNADVIIPYDIVKWRTLGRPQENGILGGLCPVAVSNKDQKELDWHQRLSGIFPFNVCYISSVPTTGTIWMGENRRDVLGAKRFPPFKRHVTDGTWDIEKPNNLADYIELVKDLDTPQEVIFTHRICGVSDSTKLDDLVDLDIESRGTTTYGIAKRVDDSERGRYNLEDAAEFGPAARR